MEFPWKALDYEGTAFNPRESPGISGLPSEANADDLTKLANNRNPQVDLWNGRNSEKAFTVECE